MREPGERVWAAPGDERRSAGAVCVLGAPRSGTSLTARILNILGVHLGSGEELMEPAGGNNPAGFWEHEGIADLNEDILATLGDAPRQRWRYPPPLEDGWEHDPRLEPHRQAARSMLERSFAGRPLWGWKDPRTCLTLPFWREALAQTAQVEARMRYAICVRHPLDVAASLEARDGMSHEESVRLWLRYTWQAVVQTSGQPRAFVSYEGYFPSWEDQAARLARFLGLADLAGAQRSAIEAHLDEDLWHHRDGGRGTDRRAEEAGLPPDAADLYALLSELCDAQTEPRRDAESRLDATAHRVAELLA